MSANADKGHDISKIVRSIARGGCMCRDGRAGERRGGERGGCMCRVGMGEERGAGKG